MHGQTYLHRSRHGVYYLRMVIPQSLRVSLGVREREVRASLRTKNKQQARVKLAPRVSAMTKLFHGLEELEQQQRLERYERGLELIRQYGSIDLNHEFQFEALTSELQGPDLEAYIFAVQYDQEYELKKVNSADPQSTQRHNPPTAPNTQSTETAAVAPAAQPRSDTSLPDEKISVAIDHFVRDKQLTANQATANKYGSQCRLFLKVIADGNRDILLSEITIQHIQVYASKLSKLPKKISLNDPRPIDDIIASSATGMSARTKFTHAQAVNMFLTWCQGQQYRIAPNLGSILAPSLKKPKPDKRRKHFTDDELKLLFESKMYQQGLFERDSDYWIPILGLFTGARQAELCQLLSSDIRQEPATSLWYIDINEDDDKHVKTDSSPRQVPIHPELERLKFVEFAQRASNNPGGRLFPDEKRNARGEFGAYSKRFNRYREDQGIINTPATYLNYHSLRHSLQNNLLGQGLEEHVVNDIVGHSQAGRSESVKTYSSGTSLQTKRDVLLKFSYALQFKLRN